MNKRIRQYIGILSAISIYYLVHEGAHLLAALHYDAFKTIHFLGLGIQIDVYPERLTDPRLGIFCLAGPVASLVLGWILILASGKICQVRSPLFKTAMWYASLTLLLLDPLYLSILCGFFGGGDMNGIRLLIPEFAARTLFVAIGILNTAIVRKYLLPKYKQAFENNERKCFYES